MNRVLAAATALSLIVGAGGLAAPAAFAQATPAQKAEPAKKAEPARKKKSDAKKSERAKEKAKSGYGKTEPKK